MDVYERHVKLGVIGLGQRGSGLLRELLSMDDVEITAVRDRNQEKIDRAQVIASEKKGVKPAGYLDYRQLLAHQGLDGVIIASKWNDHVKIAIEAMRAGIRPASEVGATASMEELWAMVETSEQTGVPCMLLENCNYGREEMGLLNMVKQGLFGEIIHCQGGYEHDLRSLMLKENPNYRIKHYIHRNGENYPTHELGPIAKILNINRGNQFLTLSSMSSKSRGLKEWAQQHLGSNHPFSQTDYAQGDIVTTMIQCANGETIVLTLDTTLPRPYSRGGRIQGTKGLWMEDNKSIHIEGRSPEHAWEPFETYLQEFEHPLWKEYKEFGVRSSGHGGMDYLVLRAFVESVSKQIAPPIDVYDAAAWRAVTVLSEQSIAQGSQPVSFPDFTKGQWIDRCAAPSSKYALDQVEESLFKS